MNFKFLLLARHGCMDCMQQMQLCENHRIYPYQETMQEKTTSFWRERYEEFSASSGEFTEIAGVKGPSMLYKMGVDPYCQNPLDYMHQAYEGVVDRIVQSILGMKFCNYVLSYSNLLQFQEAGKLGHWEKALICIKWTLCWAIFDSHQIFREEFHLLNNSKRTKRRRKRICYCMA